MVDSNFAFNDPVSADYVIDYYVEPAVIWRTHTAPMDKYHWH